MPRPTPIRGKLTAGILSLIGTAVIGLINAFQIIPLTQGQIGAIEVAVGTLGVVLVSLGILSAEGEVTPVDDPQLPEGTRVKVTDATGDVTGSTTV